MKTMLYLRPRSFLGRFFLQALIWLPIAFFFWYQVAWLFTLPSAWLSELLLNLIHPGTVEQIVGLGHETVIVTGFETATQDAQGNKATGQIVLPINPLIYSWNLPVLLALLFAANERFFSIRKLILGYFLLVPAHAWGLTFDALRSLALRGGADIRNELGFTDWTLELIALGYQFGYLMLPFIAVVTIWIMLNLRLVESLLERDSITANRRR
ncbi:exosortase H-associated membrane protein [Thioalkalivibrio sp. ALE9]|uniref:exosortase H-associated membrane protein n=1 Tax=Thioalkalivibrio sp. ALE9 TaxID=1158169 RepID=UPI0003A16D53|nr:exosortase H-associated membrane protein [Thioalkalivibrio sp. ALE9]